jgi:cell shape-determining protein MreC
MLFKEGTMSETNDTAKNTTPEQKSEAAKIAELVARIQSLVEHHAVDRGQLAEQVSQLLEENSRLKKKIAELEHNDGRTSQAYYEPTELERELGLDFSV